MNGKPIIVDKEPGPWSLVKEIAQTLDQDSFVLVGGTMIQIYSAKLHDTYNDDSDFQSRKTYDVDFLVNLIAKGARIEPVVRRLEKIGFESQEPRFHNGVFYRMLRDGEELNLLIADHLPSRKRQAAKYNNWSLFETVGGAQAIERAEEVSIAYKSQVFNVKIPNLLGALVLKSAAYSADTREAERHLQDLLVLYAQIENPLELLEDVHGSDKKRLYGALQKISQQDFYGWKLGFPQEVLMQAKKAIRVVENCLETGRYGSAYNSKGLQNERHESLITRKQRESQMKNGKSTMKYEPPTI